MIRKNPAASVSPLRLAIATVLVAAAVAAPVASAQQARTDIDEAQLRQLSEQLAALKASYAEEVRRLRELDMQVQALQARLAGKVPAAGTSPAAPAVAEAVPAAPASTSADAASSSSQAGYASTAAEAEKAKSESMSRSVADVMLVYRKMVV